MSVNDAVIVPADQAVYVRRSSLVNGETTGWELDQNLRCQSVRIAAGLGIGRASFHYVSLDRKPPAVEDVARAYSPNDQVRVELFPYDGATGADTPAEGTGLIVFEGVLERQPLSVVSNSGSEKERADFVAVAMPWIDQRSREHLVFGRWYHKPLGDPAPDPLPHWSFVESRAVPAAFNYRGRANMDADDTHMRSAFGPPAGTVLSARPFTHDDDPTGKLWTVGDALKSLLVEWLYGSGSPGRKRMTGVEDATLTALMTDPPPKQAVGGRWAGLGDVLPETDVSGMKLFEAVDAVCTAGGFDWAVEPDMAQADTSAGDRLYLLRLWRRHAGPQMDVRLPKRGAFPTDPAGKLRYADVNRLTILRDIAGVVNEVLARGRVEIEATVTLKPLWSPDDLEAEPKDPPATGFKPAPVSNQLAQGEVSDTYHDRHVQGGKDFGTYGFAGRTWGVDCTGSDAFLYYQDGPVGGPPGIYDHDPDGFDWLTELGIDGTDPLSLERVANGITAPIDWTRRIRTALPLKRRSESRRGRRFVLEVSEDGGTTWTDVTDRVAFTTLTEYFGIRINNVANLAAVNADALATGNTPAIADSWWQKILDKQLLFRLTANVPPDHEALFIATRNATSGADYNRGAVVDVDVTELWAPPTSTLNTGSSWEKLPSFAGNQSLAGDLTDAVKTAAERMRDAHEGGRWSVGFDTFLLQPWRWKLGSRVRGVAGRDLSFATNAGAEQRHPAIVEVDMVLAGPNGEGTEQGVFLSLNDTAQRRGV